MANFRHDGPDEYPRVLCVGGTDPTGAAGLFADVRAVACAGVLASGVVTAVTVQTSAGVTDVVALPSSVIGTQLDAALSEPGASVLKTGMLVGEDIVRAVAARVAGANSLRLVVDPVLASSSGRRLLDQDGVLCLLHELIPRAALVTPNLPELQILAKISGEGRTAMSQGADALLLLGAAAVLVKGGHATDEGDGLIHDLFRTADGDELWVSRSRLRGLFRGTGCTLASAIAARLALGLTLKDAVSQARDYVEQAMRDGFLGARGAVLLGSVLPTGSGPSRLSV